MNKRLLAMLIASVAVIVLGLSAGCGGDDQPPPSGCVGWTPPEQTPGASCAVDADCGARACWSGICDAGSCRYENAPATLLCDECGVNGVCNGAGTCVASSAADGGVSNGEPLYCYPSGSACEAAGTRFGACVEGECAACLSLSCGDTLGCTNDTSFSRNGDGNGACPAGCFTACPL